MLFRSGDQVPAQREEHHHNHEAGTGEQIGPGVAGQHERDSQPAQHIEAEHPAGAPGVGTTAGAGRVRSEDAVTAGGPRGPRR